MKGSVDSSVTEDKWLKAQHHFLNKNIAGFKCWKRANFETGDIWSNLEVSFELKFCFGQVGRYEQPDLTGLDKWINAYVAKSLENDIFEAEDKPYIADMAETSALFAIFVCPRVPIKSPMFHVSFLLQLAAWLHDDGVDRMDFFSSPHEKYENVLLCHHLMNQIMSGNKMDNELFEKLKYPKKKLIFSCLKQFHRLACLSINDFDNVNQYFLGGWDKYLQSQEWVAFEDTMVPSIDLSNETTGIRSGYCTGATFVIGVCLLGLGVTPSEDLRKCIIFERFMTLFNSIALASNSIWSYFKEAKELGSGVGNVLNNNCGNARKSLSDELVRTVDRINQEIVELLKLEKILNEKSPGVYDKEVRVIKEILDGNFYFQTMCPRYRKSAIEFEIVERL